MDRTFLEHSDCLALINFTFEKLGHPELVNKVPLRFSNRMTSAMGYAYRNFKLKGIQLSKPLFERATVKQRMQTIIHEACHIVQFVDYPKSKPHGYEWKSLMVKMGLDPKRTHNVNTGGLNTGRAKFLVRCDCRSFEFGKVRFDRMKNGSREYFCRVCNGKFRPA